MHMHVVAKSERNGAACCALRRPQRNNNRGPHTDLRPTVATSESNLERPTSDF
jgi:hypothetical protein